MRRLIPATGVVLILAGALPLLATTPTEFYLGLLRRGTAEVQAGQYDRGASALRIAAFGLIESVEQYQLAQVYLTVASSRLGNEPAAREAARRVAAAELVERHYASLTLPPALRLAFDELARKLLTPGEIAAIFAPTHPPGDDATASTPDRPPTQTATLPATLPPVVASTVEGRLNEARTALLASRADEARAIYRTLLASPELPRPALLQLVEGLYRTRDFDGCLRALERAGELREGEETYRFYLAVSLFEKGEYARARSELAAARPFIAASPELDGYISRIEAGRP